MELMRKEPAMDCDRLAGLQKLLIIISFSNAFYIKHNEKIQDVTVFSYYYSLSVLWQCHLILLQSI